MVARLWRHLASQRGESIPPAPAGSGRPLGRRQQCDSRARNRRLPRPAHTGGRGARAAPTLHVLVRVMRPGGAAHRNSRLAGPPARGRAAGSCTGTMTSVGAAPGPQSLGTSGGLSVQFGVPAGEGGERVAVGGCTRPDCSRPSVALARAHQPLSQWLLESACSWRIELKKPIGCLQRAFDACSRTTARRTQRERERERNSHTLLFCAISLATER